MASERPARPGALSLPGMRNSALASAALTSVALLAQTANAAPQSGDEAPSREEISRRVSSLYDQAESDTGTFNATRASSTGPRQRADRPADSGRGSAAGAGSEGGRRGDSGLDGVARQWFDIARARLGPTVSAAVPGDTAAERPAGPRSARPSGGPGGTREAAGRAALELPAAPAGESASGMGRRAPLAEPSAGPVAALPAAPQTPWSDQGPGGAPALRAPGAEPAAEQQERSSLRTGKERNQRKLQQARDLMSAYTAARSAPVAAIEAPSVTDTWGAAPAAARPSAGAPWRTPEAQSPADLVTVPAEPTSWTGAPAPSTDAFGQADPLTGTGSFAVADPLTSTGSIPQVGPLTSTGSFPQVDPLTSTGSYAHVDPLTSTGSYAVADPLTSTGSIPQVDPLSSTGSFAVPQDSRAVRALDFARAQIGKPCVWGTSGPGSYDGPGLTRAAWKAAGITLPRTAPEQATAGQGVALDRLEPGDLVLFHVGHVGIYSGDGRMIHAPGPGTAVREESIHYAGESALHSAIRPA